MVSIQSEFSKLLNGLPAWPIFLVLLVVSLLLIFFGRKVVKALAFLIVGVIVGSVGGTLAAHYLTSLGSLGGVLGFFIGFLVGGLLGLLLVRVGIGLVVAYAAYLLTLDVVSNRIAAIVVGIVFFVVGVVLYNKIVTALTAIAGGLLLFVALTFYVDPIIAAAVAVLATAAGLWYNFRHGRSD